MVSLVISMGIPHAKLTYSTMPLTEVVPGTKVDPTVVMTIAPIGQESAAGCGYFRDFLPLVKSAVRMKLQFSVDLLI